MVDEEIPELRLSDVERDEIVTQLGVAMSDGRLDVTEYEERSRQVYTAKVPSDLTGVLDGLPIAAPATAAPAVVPASNGAQIATASSDRRRWFVSLLGDRVQRGDLDLGKTATTIGLLGDTTFDLTEVTAAQVHLQIFSLMGDVKIRVRPGTSIDANVIVLMGDRDDTATTRSTPTSMNVRLQIFSLMGDVKIRVVD